MSIVLRALALVGAVAHGVNQMVARLLPFLPQRLPGALLVATILAAGSVLAVRATSEAIASRPEPTPLPLGEVIEGNVNEWITVRGLLSGPHVDNSLYADTDVHFVRIRDDPHDREDPELVPPGARTTIFRLGGSDGVPRWFYVLRDPEDPARGIIVRSPREGRQIRDRAIRARVVGRHEGVPLLVEIGLASVDGDERPDTGAALASPNGEVIVAGVFADGAETDADTWRYRLEDPTDGATLAFVDASHPPDALPVELSGLVATDAYHLDLVLETDEMDAALAGVAHSDSRLFLDGVGPLLPETSYLPAALLGGAAGFLLLSQLIGYPIFRRGGRAFGSERRPVIGEPILAQLDGLLPAPAGPRVIRGSSVELAWMPRHELERRAWQLRHQLADTGDGAPRLALVAAEDAFLMQVEPLRDALSVERGDIVASSVVRPGLRLRAPGLRATLTFASETDRARAERELDPGTPPAMAGVPPESEPQPVARATPLPRFVTAGGLGLVGLLVVAASIADLVTGASTPIGLVAPVLAAASLLLLGRGLLLRSSWAREMLPSVAMLGIVVAAVLAIGGSACGSWLLPTLESCPPFSPLTLVIPVVSVVVFGIGLWATPRLVREPGR
ncbi:MAG: hypothetical protein ACRDGD_02260 [Candidatus Limnocylindria bacterium]